MILGKHSISETREFAKLIDFRVAAEDKLLESKRPLPQDAATVEAIARYTAWRANWQKVCGEGADSHCNRLLLKTLLEAVETQTQV